MPLCFASSEATKRVFCSSTAPATMAIPPSGMPRSRQIWYVWRTRAPAPTPITSLCFLRLLTMASSTGPMAFLPRSRMLCPPRTRIFTSGRMQTSVSESVEAITCLLSRDSRINLLGIWARLGRLTAGEAMNYPPGLRYCRSDTPSDRTRGAFFGFPTRFLDDGGNVWGEKNSRRVAAGCQRKLAQAGAEEVPVPYHYYDFELS